jgi:hypothetical protein
VLPKTLYMTAALRQKVRSVSPGLISSELLKGLALPVRREAWRAYLARGLEGVPGKLTERRDLGVLMSPSGRDGQGEESFEQRARVGDRCQADAVLVAPILITWTEAA